MSTRNGTITAEQRLTVVKHLAHGRGVQFVATATGIDQQTVRSIGNDHGGCDNPDALTRAAEQLAKKGDEDARTAGITPRPDLEERNANRITHNTLRGTENATPRGAAPHHEAHDQNLESRSQSEPGKQGKPFDATAALLLRGKDSERKRTQNLAQRIEDQLVDLRDRLDDEDTQRRERERREAEKQEARDEVAELEKQLAEARSKLRSPAKAKRTDAIKNGEPRQHKAPSRSALIRQWAADNGYECPAFGRVPRRICDAYTDAHATDQQGAAT